MRIIILISALMLYISYSMANPIEFIITNNPDSVSIYDNSNNLIAKVLWGSNAINGQNDIIQADVNSYYIIPPCSGARNYSLSLPVLLQPKNINTIKFNSFNVKIRIYADTSIFNLDELDTHIGAYKVIEQDSTYFRYELWNIANISQTFVEFYLDSISTNNMFLLSAVNILMGTINNGDLPELISEEVLVPVTKSAILYEGVSFLSTNYSGIVVKGNLTCVGTETNPVNLDLWVEIMGDDDDNFQNNEEKFNCLYTYCQRLLIKWANSFASKSDFLNIHLSNYSKSTFNNISLEILWCYDSKLKIESSHFNYGGQIFSKRSIVFVEDCYFEFYDYATEHHDSYLHFKNNSINVDASITPFKSLRSLVIFEGNRIVYAGEPGQNWNRGGISIWSDSYGIIHHNIIEGFGRAIGVGYTNKAIIYNNSFVYNRTGIEVYATPDTISIYNNIFVNYNRAIDLDYSTYNGGTNVSYVNNNLWNELSGNHPLIHNPEDSSIVIGNDFFIHSDPLFTDTIDYKLSENSPAIDQGTNVIPSFSFNFEVLDTIISVQDSIIINDYWGNAPDLGANEYDPTADVINQPDKSIPDNFGLVQNYPNPFNPSTRIQYAVSSTQFVSLKVYDVLGNEIATLVNEEKPAGSYEVEFTVAQNSILSSGIYFYQLKAGNYIEAKKMVLMK